MMLRKFEALDAIGSQTDRFATVKNTGSALRCINSNTAEGQKRADSKKRISTGMSLGVTCH